MYKIRRRKIQNREATKYKASRKTTTNQVLERPLPVAIGGHRGDLTPNANHERKICNRQKRQNKENRQKNQVNIGEASGSGRARR